MEDKPSVVVIGSGIVGMSTAVRLAERGLDVSIVSREPYSETTSSVAAAFWYPYKAEPADKVYRWASLSLSVYRVAAGIPEAGVVWHTFSELFDAHSELPWWHGCVDDFESHEDVVELPVGHRRVCTYKVPIIDSSSYLPYLRAALVARAVKFEEQELASLDEAFDKAEIVVNCSGLGAMKLAKDDDLHPARGQVVRIKRRVEHVPVVDLTLEPKIAHVTPRLNDTVLGGTYEENVFDLTPDLDETQAIVSRCRAVCPELGEIEPDDILGVSCGLRPVRSMVRVESERHKRGWLFHNYGHGGAGFTLAWGCAEEICELVGSVVGGY